jgi:hypothetical protein
MLMAPALRTTHGSGNTEWSARRLMLQLWCGPVSAASAARQQRRLHHHHNRGHSHHSHHSSRSSMLWVQRSPQQQPLRHLVTHGLRQRCRRMQQQKQQQGAASAA